MQDTTNVWRLHQQTGTFSGGMLTSQMWKLQEDWEAEFGKYKASPEYHKVNRSVLNASHVFQWLVCICLRCIAVYVCEGVWATHCVDCSQRIFDG